MIRTIVFVAALILSQAPAWAQQSCTTDARRVVDELYRHMLERAADPGSAGHVTALENGSATVRDLVRTIAKSPEHQQRFFNRQEDGAYLRAVNTLYRHILGRQPDASGARRYADLAASRGFDPVVDEIVASREYLQAYGDFGVPGSGGLQYCGSSNQSRQAPDQRPESRQASNMRFRQMDQNGDGVVTLREWQGSRQSFDVHDWNQDGMLSGDELRADARRDDRSFGDENFDRADRFEYLDTNRNGRIERREWHGNAQAFDWLDRNRDNFLSRAEMIDNGGAIATSGQVVRVNASVRWTDTGLLVRAGDQVSIDADGYAHLSSNPNDVAGPNGISRGRRFNGELPFPRQPAGALIARVGNSNPMFVGAGGPITAPVNGRLYLGINDDYLQDNSGEFRVRVDVLR